ncbi:hypothetical protein SAMN05444337_1444 [Flavobacterium haoranii]|uniref:Uncharacterized protein n=1 Tax=Flavobacterium haoranii TaxID=683124 RepID=A0A1M6H6D0_9FLAO|nr:hypothetical protein SAMN05444337_1444 [Flavobacterium haoranii]
MKKTSYFLIALNIISIGLIVYVSSFGNITKDLTQNGEIIGKETLKSFNIFALPFMIFILNIIYIFKTSLKLKNL